MKLRSSWTILLLAVGSAGQPVWHHLGDFGYKAECDVAHQALLKEMKFEMQAGVVTTDVRWGNSVNAGVPDGSVTSGGAPGACEVIGSSMSGAAFFLDSTSLQVGTNTATRITCNLDTTKFPDGWHVLRADVTTPAGVTKIAKNLFFRNNSATPMPTTTPPPIATIYPSGGTAPEPISGAKALISSGCVQKS